MEEKKVPALRFRGFDNAWEQRRVGEFLSISKVPGHTGLNAKKLTVKLWGKGIIEKTDKLSGSENTRYYVRYAGQFMYGKLDFLHAAFGIVPDDLDNYESTLDSPAFDLHNIDGKFLLERVTQKDFYLRNGMTANGSRKAKRVHEDVFLNMDLVVTSYQEQEIIGKFFNKFDHLISLHQRKLEMLKKVKKSMLEKMFPKNDAKVPEVRFSDFTDAWEQRCFSELYEKSNEKNDGSLGIEKNITVATMQFKTDIKVSTVEYLRTYYTFKKGDIAFEGHQSKEFRFGRFVENDIGDGIVSHIFAVFRPIVDYDLYFWKYAINNEALMQAILSRSTKASTMMHDLVVSDFLRECFSVPLCVEQRKIGSIFNKLGHLISLHQRKLEKLKNIKKSMLEKMFII